MEVPAGTSSTETREWKAFACKALGNVPRRVHAQHEEWYAPGAVARQSRQAVGDLFDAGAEFRAKPVDAVPMAFRCRQKRGVRHHDRTGCIIGERYVEQPSRWQVRRGSAIHKLGKQGSELEQSKLIGDREHPAFRPQQIRKHQSFAMQIVMLVGAVEHFGRNDLRVDAERILEPRP
jgi:hypothetical protein